jgi:hypothetical protein
MFIGDFFGLFRENSVCFGCFDRTETPKQTETNRNKPKQTEKNVFWFRKTNRKQPKQIEFRFVLVRTEKKI